jgi:hypothetical protein
MLLLIMARPEFTHLVVSELNRGKEGERGSVQENEVDARLIARTVRLREDPRNDVYD